MPTVASFVPGHVSIHVVGMDSIRFHGNGRTDGWVSRSRAEGVVLQGFIHTKQFTNISLQPFRVLLVLSDPGQIYGL